MSGLWTMIGPRASEFREKPAGGAVIAAKSDNEVSKRDVKEPLVGAGAAKVVPLVKLPEATCSDPTVDGSFIKTSRVKELVKNMLKMKLSGKRGKGGSKSTGSTYVIPCIYEEVAQCAVSTGVYQTLFGSSALVGSQDFKDCANLFDMWRCKSISLQFLPTVTAGSTAANSEQSCPPFIAVYDAENNYNTNITWATLVATTPHTESRWVKCGGTRLKHVLKFKMATQEKVLDVQSGVIVGTLGQWMPTSSTASAVSGGILVAVQPDVSNTLKVFGHWQCVFVVEFREKQ